MRITQLQYVWETSKQCEQLSVLEGEYLQQDRR